MPVQRAEDIQWMKRAIELSKQARLHAAPNPWVGCVIVKEKELVGEGYTQPPGYAHAEIGALRQAKEQSRGATLYVTLEPCCHEGRTPPCTADIVQAGIQRVVVGIRDPDRRVNGGGIAWLKGAGISVTEGICADEIVHSLTPYLHHRQTLMPYTILKAAISLDGRMAAADGQSQWITGPEARRDTHSYRAHSQGIVIGAGTALTDHPQLTVRGIEGLLHPPLRILLDATGRVPAEGPLFDRSLAPTLVITTSASLASHRIAWEKRGAEVVEVAPSREGVDLFAAWRLLGERGLLQLLVEGGATVHTSLLNQALCQQLLIYVGPCLLGSSALPFYRESLSSLSAAYPLALSHVAQLGDSVRLTYLPFTSSEPLPFPAKVP